MASVRVAGTVGSPRKGMNTDTLVTKALAGAQSVGTETTKIYQNDLEIRPCQACSESPSSGYCSYKDGGVPRGRITEIYGPEGSGKTTLCLHVIAEAQQMGGKAAIIDVEHALDPTYAAVCGVDVDELYISQPDTGEEALEITEALIRSGALAVVVIDSVAALVPRAELQGDMGDSHPGLQARLMSQALRKLSGAIKASNTAILFTNQIRHKIGVRFGSPETTSGGRALRFYASARLDIRRIQAIKWRGTVVGNRTRVRVKKNKVAPPFRQAEFDIMYDEGISRAGDVLDLAVEMEVVEKRGSFYSYQDERLAQGRENSKQVLRDDPPLLREIENIVREASGLSPLPAIVPEQPVSVAQAAL